MNAPVTDATDPVLRSLLDEHRRLDERLRDLGGQRSLTAAEQLELRRIKKLKLWTKDRIERLRTSAGA